MNFFKQRCELGVFFKKVLGITALSKGKLTILVTSGRRDLWRHVVSSEPRIESKSHDVLEILPISFISWSPVTALNSEKTELAPGRSSIEWGDCVIFSLFRQALIICKFFGWLARRQKFSLFFFGSFCQQRRKEPSNYLASFEFS